jgi:hypothetical protein
VWREGGREGGREREREREIIVNPDIINIKQTSIPIKVAHVPRPLLQFFNVCNIEKSREWPGDEASSNKQHY